MRKKIESDHLVPRKVRHRATSMERQPDRLEGSGTGSGDGSGEDPKKPRQPSNKDDTGIDVGSESDKE